MRAGLVAGILVGGALMLAFLLYDLLRFEAFATPRSLSRIFGTGKSGAQGTDLSFFPIAAFSVVHIAAFAMLGLGCAMLLHEVRPKRVWMFGALYGLVVCSLALGVTLELTGATMSAAPGWPPVLVANTAAGLLMVGWVRLTGG